MVRPAGLWPGIGEGDEACGDRGGRVVESGSL